ncbi:hypothetical protein [Ancylobacter sp. TS-1]|uniref:hypothetical protein n=1 Tax=Ancylobacter sp. TS-1 TaxID=1850374 RepID=UPI001265BFB4|nr:hypothetical protein [Ancylobacter sp. TS-1]QFR33986.1 hypothetical protein GBB76_13155 [Ancylobacter sp. TS-1]
MREARIVRFGKPGHHVVRAASLPRRPASLIMAFAAPLDDGTGLAALLAQGWPGRVWRGASLGTPAEKLLAGPLAEAGEEILRTRAGINAVRGWVMDVWVGIYKTGI